MPSRSAINVSLTPEFTAYVGDCVASGQYRTASEVVREALRRLQQITPDAVDASNQAFLLRFSDRISPLKDPRRIMTETAYLLGSHLAADRAGYSEISADGEQAIIRAEWMAGDMPGLAGTHRVRDYGAPLLAELRRGVTVSYADARDEPLALVSDAVAAAFAAAGHRASIAVPLVKDGSLQAVLFVHQRETREWTMADERLVREVAERTWAAVERARAETALGESEARFRGVFETAFQMMGLLSTDGVVLEANEAAISFAGVPADQIIGRKLWETPWWTQSPDSSAPGRLQAAVAEAASGTASAFAVEVRAAGGRAAVVDFSLRPIRDASQAIVFLLPEGHDITGSRRALERLAESEARFSALAEAMPQMIWASDADGRIIYSNARYLDFVGSSAGVQAVPWEELVHPDDRALSHELRRQSLLTGRPFEREHRLRRFDGVYRWVLARALPVQDASGRIETWFGTTTDIGEIVEARQVLKQTRDELEVLVQSRTRVLEDAARELAAEMQRREELQTNLLQAQKLEALGQLTSGVAHDFNNVLTAITGSYALLRSRTDYSAQMKIIDHGERAVERATRLVGQLLSFVRREKSEPRVLELGSMLPEVADLLCHAIGSGMRCAFEISPDIDPVLADPYELEVALLNLAVNARDAMDGNGVIRITGRNLAPHELPGQLRPGPYVSIGVSDTGVGMPPDVVARATESFFTTKPEGKGTGLGLPMVNGFATRQGGCVRIGSRPGLGTDVEIILPRAPVADDIGGGIAGADVASATDSGAHGNATVLLVDNDEALRRPLAMTLRRLGYVVLEAGGAEVANALVRTLSRLDLLVTDMLMPLASGPMLAHSLRTDWPALPVLFLTGGPAGPELAGETMLAKPFSTAALAAAVLKALGRSSLPEDPRNRLMQRLNTPALRRFYLNWQTCNVEGEALPRLSRIDPARFGLGPHCFLVRVEDHMPPVFRFISVGSALTRRLGRPLEGMVIEDTVGDEDVLGELHATYRRCMRSYAPVYQGARFRFGDEGLSFERLVLPISDDARTITHLVGIVVFTDTMEAAA